MELRVLNYFLTVAREENITRAAQLLHITQPTLSRQLMQLEEELGVQLFHRGKHSISLTNDGMLLRRRAQEIVSLSEKTKSELQRKEEIPSGEIAIGCGETVSFCAKKESARTKTPQRSFCGRRINSYLSTATGSISSPISNKPFSIRSLISSALAL